MVAIATPAALLVSVALMAAVLFVVAWLAGVPTADPIQSRQRIHVLAAVRQIGALKVGFAAPVGLGVGILECTPEGVQYDSIQ
mgnify:CR=1 FL=1